MFKGLSRTRLGVLLAVSLLACCPTCTAGTTTEARDGDIYLRTESGVMMRITNSGHDHSPAVSYNCREIVFVRDLLGDVNYNDATKLGVANRVMQLWTADLGHGNPPKLILDSPIEVKGKQFSGYYIPQFSSDCRFIYFLIQFGVGSGAVVRVPSDGGQPGYITEARDFAVIPVGKYKDDLIVLQHRHKLGTGYYDCYYLLNPDGREIGVIGQDKGDVDDFASMYVGDPGECPLWSGPEWMVCISEME